MARFSTAQFLRCTLLAIGSLLMTLGGVRAQPLSNEGLVADTTELRVLRQFYNATNGPQWTNDANWLTGTTLADAATWFGVEVEQGDVVRLWLPVNNVQGAAAAALGQLTALQFLNLSNNQLTGTLPGAWGRLRALRQLNVNNNRLNGTLPDSLARLRQLGYLGLEHNLFRGPLTPLAALVGLGQLDLADNDFMGSLEPLRRLYLLEYVSLAGNHLSGPLDALAALPRLRRLDLRGNDLTGTLPNALLQGPLLQAIYLGGNQLTDVEPLTGINPAFGFNFTDNALDFAALEQLYQGPNQPRLGYLEAGGQRPSPRLDTTHYQAGSRLELSIPRGEQHGYRYQWQRLVGGLWLDMVGDTLATKYWAVATAAEQGTYRRAGRNRWFTDPILAPTMLYSPMLYADLVPYQPLARNRPNDANTGLRLASPLLAPDATAARPGDVNYVRTWTPRVALTALGQTPTGSILRERWNNISGMAVTTLPLDTSPTSHDYPTALEGFTNAGDSYGTRLRGYLCPPLSGAYILWVSGDDNCQLWLSPDESPANKVLIASVTTWTNWHAWNATPAQRSNTVTLVAGRRYYVEVLQKEEDGYDNVAVAWQRPDYGFEGPIPGRYLAPLDGELAPDALNTADALVTTQYLDGLGRPLQTVQHRASPLGRDLVQPIAYDALGRSPKQFLPYAADTARIAGHTTAQGYHYQALADQQQFYYRTTLPGGGTGPLAPDDATIGVARTGRAFAETVYEASPLNRVRAQGAAGEAWQPTAGHVVERSERPNTAADSVLRFVPGYNPSSQDPGYAGCYAPGELWGTVVADAHGPSEPGAIGYVTIEWKDKQGQLVLRQVEANRAKVAIGPVSPGTAARPQTVVRSRWLRTAYAYDDFGRLRYVVQPEGTRRLLPISVPATGTAPCPASVVPFLFHYRFDARGRQIAKQVPGTDGETLVVYDVLDRPVLSQDVAQRARREWNWTKYDAMGRMILSGLVTYADTISQGRMQALAAAGPTTTSQYEQRSTIGPHFYTTTQAFPRLGQGNFGPGTVLSVTYYDDYNFNNDAQGTAEATYDPSTDSQFPNGAAPMADAMRTTGMTTRTKTRVLGVAEDDLTQAAWLTTTTFYDERARPVQVQTTNARKGTDLLTTQLDFMGKVVQSVAMHTGPNHTPVTVAEFFTYDPTGRLLTTMQQLPGEAQPSQIASVAYNELGQVTKKTMGTGRLAQQVDYAYNIRGWLTQLNNPAYPATGDLFNLSLHYEQGFTKDFEQYNGNLTGQTWRGRDGVQRAYGYAYDPLNRLLQGDFVARNASASASTPGLWKSEEDNYRLSFASYDDNGNLLTLRRRGLLANATHATTKQYGAVDNLTYAYAGNRLQAVDDLISTNQLPRPADYHGAPASLAGDFQEQGVHQQQEYLYDANGNLTQDRNKGITAIAYNYLNLPRLIRFGSGADSIVFRYTAAGQKVAKLVYQTGKPTLLRTDYLGPYQYEDDSLRFFPHAEGRVLRFVSKDAAGQPTTSYQREFTFKDHLGNLRLAYRLGQVHTYTATLEQDSVTPGRERQQFDAPSVSPPVAVPTGLAQTGSYAARLNAGGATPHPLGPLTQLTVQKGDTLFVTAPGRYQQATTNNTFSLLSFIASLLQPAPAGTPPGADGSRRGGLPLLQVGLSSATLLALHQLPGGVPKGYLRVLSFNEDSVLVDQRTVQLTDSALNNYQTLRSGQLIVQQNGYVSVYVGNESAADVYFDDVTIEHRQGLQVQENQYDPFGLDLAGVSGAAPGLRLKNFYQFNGKENQLDLGLNWNHQDWRFYDYQIGRWHVVDPEIENAQESWTPYSFGFDNAVRYADANGRNPGDPPVGSVAGLLYNTVVGTGVSLVNASIMTIPGADAVTSLTMGGTFRASLGGNGEVSYGIRPNATTLRGAVSNAASDVVDLGVAALTVFSAGEAAPAGGSLRMGAGMLFEQASVKVGANAAAQEVKALSSPWPRINRQMQDAHVPGTKEYARRLANGTPTSAFFGKKSGDALTRKAWHEGKIVKTNNNETVKQLDLPFATGTGPNGGVQKSVRAHMGSKKGLHGHSSGPEF